MKVLFVEDSERLRRWVGRGLRDAGFIVDESGDGEDGCWRAQSNAYEVILLDLMLPGLSGLEILRRLRAANSQASVLILTAKDAVEDRVRGLEMGADDYIVKPFAFEELLARLRSVVRRRHQVSSLVIPAGPVLVNTIEKIVTRDGAVIDLAPREYAILELLALHRGRVVTRAQIEAQLHDMEDEISSNVADTVIYALRRKIDRTGDSSFIHTERGVGYVLDADASVESAP